MGNPPLPCTQNCKEPLPRVSGTSNAHMPPPPRCVMGNVLPTHPYPYSNVCFTTCPASPDPVQAHRSPRLTCGSKTSSSMGFPCRPSVRSPARQQASWRLPLETTVASARTRPPPASSVGIQLSLENAACMVRGAGCARCVVRVARGAGTSSHSSVPTSLGTCPRGLGT